MNDNTPNPYLASGTITITSPPADIEIYYLEHPSRNCTLQPIVNGLELNERQTAELEDKIKDKELRLKKGRARYGQLAIQDQIWDSEES